MYCIIYLIYKHKFTHLENNEELEKELYKINPIKMYDKNIFPNIGK